MIREFSLSLLASLKRWDRIISMEEKRMLLLRKRVGISMKEMLDDRVFDKIQMTYHLEIKWKPDFEVKDQFFPSFISLHYPSHIGFGTFDNWNELKGSDHPIADISFCYAMSCLIFHPLFDWELLANIEQIKLHLHTDYSFAV